ncbi:MAG: fimbrillin family protein [Prevotellaceae bacterium]|jgi:uncharacterized protein (TIGR02145 family)|nr:fimbrillin family protein [Prevotellaceae bacterium]
MKKNIKVNLKMRSNLLHGSAALLISSLLLTTSCVNRLESEEVNVVEGDVPITFISQVNKLAVTRVADQAFDEGDKIGLFGMISPGAVDGKRYINNVKLECTGGSMLVPEKTVYYPEGNEALDFVAYHPYQSKGITNNKSVLTVSVKADQSKQSAYSASDFLVAKESGVESSNEAVNLTFKHKLSKLKIVLVPVGGEKVTDMLKANPHIVATGFKTQCTYDLKNDLLGAAEKETNITPYGTWKVDADNLVGKEFIIVPQSVDAKTHSIIIEWNGRIYTSPMPTLTTEGGYQYEIKIEARQSDSDILPGIVGKVEGWALGESKDTTSSDSALAIHVSAFSFADSDIYRIYRDGMPIIDVCKEYLISQKMTGTAIVAYPLNEYEQPDLNNGLLLQMPDFQDMMVGGKISWNTKSNSFSYTEGTSEEIDKFYVDENNNVTVKLPDNPIKVNVVSYLLTDNRKGEVKVQIYPIVKIGIHYWMKESLRATRYRDGMNLARKTVLDGKAGYIQPTDKEIYFYTGEAVTTGELAPDKWKIPSADEWKLFQTYINDNASWMKAGVWESPTAGAEVKPVNNLTGFSAISDGHWTGDGWKNAQKMVGYWAMDGKQLADKIPYLAGDESGIVFTSGLLQKLGYYKGVSIRCIKDN